MILNMKVYTLTYFSTQLLEILEASLKQVLILPMTNTMNL